MIVKSFPRGGKKPYNDSSKNVSQLLYLFKINNKNEKLIFYSIFRIFQKLKPKLNLKKRRYKMIPKQIFQQKTNQ